MSILLKMRFKSNEQITDITNVNNKITFNKNSILNKNNKCCYFPPYNKSEGFEITGNTKDSIINCLKVKSNFTIYFKYKINSIDMEEITPIISYKKDENNIIPFLYIKNKSYFTYYFQDYGDIYSKDSNHTFNGKWHTFCLTKINNNIYKFFIDGLLVSNYNLTNYNIYQDIPPLTSLYIGYSKISDNIYTFNNGYLDDICITDTINYTRSFIPPVNFFTENDKNLNNYKYKNKNYTSILTKYKSLDKYITNKTALDDFDKEILKEYDENFNNAVKKIYNYTKNEICKKIKSYNIIPLECSWNIVNYFYKNDDIMYLDNKNDSKYNNYISIEIQDLNTLKNKDIQTFDNTDIFEFDPFKNDEPTTYLDLVNDKKLLYIAIFINNVCIKLSSVLISIENEHYFLLIDKKEITDQINSIDILLFPYFINQNIKYFENYDEVLNFINTNNAKNYKCVFTFDSNGKYKNDIYSRNNKCWYFLYKYSNITISYYNNNYNIDLYNTNTEDSNEFTQQNFILNNNSEIEKNEYFFKKDSKNNIINSNNFHINNKYYIKLTYKNISSNEKIFDIPKKFSSIEEENNFKGIIKTYRNSKNKTYHVYNNLLNSIYIKFLLFNEKEELLIKDVDYKIDDENTKITLLKDIDKDTTFKFYFIIPKYDKNYFNYIDPLYIKLNFKEEAGNFYIFTIPKDYNIILIKDMIYYIINIDSNNNHIDIEQDEYSIDSNKQIKINKNKINNTNNTYICLLQIKNTLNNPLTEKEKIILSYIKNKRSFILQPLNIDNKYIITLDNFICFDQDGKYISKNKIDGKIYNLNIIKYLYCKENNDKKLEKNRIIQNIICLYNTNSNNIPISKNNILKIYAIDKLKKYITLDYNIYNLEGIFYNLMNEFDFDYNNPNLDYYQIYSRFLNYIVNYNQNIFDFYYTDNATVIRSAFKNTKNGVYSDLEDKKYFTSNKLNFKINKNNFSHSYYLFFTNNILAPWMNNLMYDSDTLKEKPGKELVVYNNIYTNEQTLCKYFDIFEIKNISNYLYKVTTSSLIKEEIKDEYSI